MCKKSWNNMTEHLCNISSISVVQQTLQSKLMAKSNKSFLYKATKNATRNHDAAKLDILQDKFIKYGIPTIREHIICDEKLSTPNYTFQI